jgi:hypothetical protein
MLFRGGDAALNDPDQKTHTYEIHPRKDQHGVNLISDVLPFVGCCIWKFAKRWHTQSSTADRRMRRSVFTMQPAT